MRILILRGGALGDFLVTLPALRALRRKWPKAEIELVGNAVAAQLGLESGDLTAVHAQSEARWAQLYGSAPLVPELQSWLDRFDWIVSFWADPDGDLQRHLRQRKPRFIHRGAAVTATPAAAHFCEPLSELGVVKIQYDVALTFSTRAMAEAEQRLASLTRFAAIHPGSGSSRKNWPYARWRELILSLNQPTLLITGEADQVPEELLRLPQIHHAPRWPLSVLGAALARSGFFLGHDSGVSHLAAAAGATGLLLFGPTDPAVWAPPTKRMRVLRGNGSLDTITVSAAQARLADLAGSDERDQR